MSKDNSVEQISSVLPQVSKEEEEEDDHDEKKMIIIPESSYHDDEGEEGDCRTPTSEENKIPPLQSCPAAPKKPRAVISLRKRKLCPDSDSESQSQLQFFEHAGRDEVDSFLKSCSDQFSRVSSSLEASATSKKRLTMEPR